MESEASRYFRCCIAKRKLSAIDGALCSDRLRNGENYVKQNRDGAADRARRGRRFFGLGCRECSVAAAHRCPNRSPRSWIRLLGDQGKASTDEPCSADHRRGARLAMNLAAARSMAVEHPRRSDGPTASFVA